MPQEPQNPPLLHAAETMPTTSKRTLWIGAVILLCGAGLSVLFFFPPESHAFYPRCTLYASTGLQCPGCGGLRAMHQLLHGNLPAAFQLNPLFVTLLPLLAAFGFLAAALRIAGQKFPPLLLHPACGFILLGLLITFTIARNLP